ncbi:hypothetical protein PG984_006168 [Apiospora sp. TS-2023a]
MVGNIYLIYVKYARSLSFPEDQTSQRTIAKLSLNKHTAQPQFLISLATTLTTGRNHGITDASLERFPRDGSSRGPVGAAGRETGIEVGSVVAQLGVAEALAVDLEASRLGAIGVVADEARAAGVDDPALHNCG